MDNPYTLDNLQRFADDISIRFGAQALRSIASNHKTRRKLIELWGCYNSIVYAENPLLLAVRGLPDDWLIWSYGDDKAFAVDLMRHTLEELDITYLKERV